MARLEKCPCGSGLWPDANHDGHGIFLCYTCDKCHKEKMSKYRSDIHERYDADEPIEDEDASTQDYLSNEWHHKY